MEKSFSVHIKALPHKGLPFVETQRVTLCERRHAPSFAFCLFTFALYCVYARRRTHCSIRTNKRVGAFFCSHLALDCARRNSRISFNALRDEYGDFGYGYHGVCSRVPASHFHHVRRDRGAIDVCPHTKFVVVSYEHNPIHSQ